jgi:hypothetical protein
MAFVFLYKKEHFLRIAVSEVEEYSRCKILENIQLK